MENPPIHKFVVFSEIDESGNIEPSFAQCTKCDLIHKVKEVGVSEILKKENLASLMTIPEIKSNLPEKLIQDIANYELELYQWQEIKWIMDNEAWGRAVILVKEETDGVTTGKYLQIIGSTLWKFSNFTREELIAYE